MSSYELLKGTMRSKYKIVHSKETRARIAAMVVLTINLTKLDNEENRLNSGYEPVDFSHCPCDDKGPSAKCGRR